MISLNDSQVKLFKNLLSNLSKRISYDSCDEADKIELEIAKELGLKIKLPDQEELKEVGQTYELVEYAKGLLNGIDDKIYEYK